MARFERHGVLGTEINGVFFTESAISGAKDLGGVTANSDRQNTSLDTIKLALAKQVRAKGGNVLMQFSYVQKGTVFSFSSVRMTASGTAASVVEP